MRIVFYRTMLYTVSMFVLHYRNWCQKTLVTGRDALEKFANVTCLSTLNDNRISQSLQDHTETNQ